VLSQGNGLLVGELSLSACREKLESRTMGRLGVNVDALPVVLPVNYAVDGDSIVIRTVPGTKLTAAMSEAVVAFEIDDYDPEFAMGWSVLVQGRSREITQKDRLDSVRSLPLPHVTVGGATDRFIEVDLEIVTGRCIEPLEDADSSEQA